MEAVITATIVIDKLLGMLIDETISFRGVRGVLDPQIDESLKEEMKRIQTVVKKVDVWDDAIANAWLEEVADVAQRLELVMDTYLLRMAQRRNQPEFIIKWISGPSVASEIQDIISKLQRLRKRGESHLFILQQGFKRCGPVEVLELPFHIKVYEAVGIDSEKEQLVSMLVGEPSTRLAISLVGSGGVGKTTLASSVYDNEVMRRHFDCLVWIIVPQTYNLEELFRALTAQVSSGAGDSVGREIFKMQLQELRSRLNQYLSMKRYLIVFDDVWKTDFWEDINQVLPNNNRGSRIVITTRNNETAATACDIVQTIQPFSEERALQLFYKRAFRFEAEGSCPPELEKLSLEFVRSCHGLPLVITALADFLSKEEKVVSKWRKLLHQFNNEFEKMPFFERVASLILSRSYDDLPQHVRPCFLYFGIFRKYDLIPDLKLYKYWIAEGFVREEIGKTLEQVAATYLNELISRNLVQVSYINYYGTERMCRVQAFMCDIILARAKDFGISQTSKERSSRRKIRHLSIYDDMSNILETIEQSQVRSVFLFSVNEFLSKPLVINLFERLKFLELLNFENAPLSYLPNEVGNLFYLKYLSLRNTKVNKLPKSVGLLLNLQTLDVRNTLIRELPIHILKLQKLRHLLASAHNNKLTMADSIHGVRIREGIACLENLQTLFTVEAHGSGFGILEELEKLRLMRWLSISKLTADKAKTLCASIRKMNHLESLSLYSSNDTGNFDLESISSPPPLLRRLILKCCLEKMPDWIARLQNLNVLGLSFSRLAIDPLKALHGLPNLVYLWLHQAYIGEQLHFVENGFPKLKQLVLTELHNLRRMRIDRGALLLLEKLRIGPSPDELSSDTQHLRNLQVIEYYDMPDEFVRRLQPEGGSDYWKIEHVPSVVFWYRVQGRRYVSYKLGEPDLLAQLKGFSGTANVKWHERPLSFFCNDDEELVTTSSAKWREQRSLFSYDDDEELSTTSSAKWSEQGSFFSDDIED